MGSWAVVRQRDVKLVHRGEPRNFYILTCSRLPKPFYIPSKGGPRCVVGSETTRAATPTGTTSTGGRGGPGGLSYRSYRRQAQSLTRSRGCGSSPRGVACTTGTSATSTRSTRRWRAPSTSGTPRTKHFGEYAQLIRTQCLVFPPSTRRPEACPEKVYVGFCLHAPP